MRTRMERRTLATGSILAIAAAVWTTVAITQAGPRLDRIPDNAGQAVELTAIEAPTVRELPSTEEQIADHEIGRARAQGRVSVLVHMDPAKGPNPRAAVRAFAAANQGVVRYEYDTVLPDVINVRNIPEGRLNALAAIPGVTRVEKDEYHENVVRLHDSMPLIRGLQSQITGAGYSADGTGVRICVVDTGIDSDHVMFSARIDASAGYDFYNNDPDPEDDHGHGSHCSGIALGRTGLTWDPCGTGAVPFQGVAPNATLIGAKVLNSSGGGFDSDIIAGINHCADQSPSGGRADIISMSIGTGNFTGPCSHSWAVAANNAVANGVVAIAASGNENNSNSMGSPACGADVIAVGMTWKNDYPTCEDATTNWNWGICVDFAPQTDDVGCFSNESDYLDVTAPGANIWSASIAAGGGSITGKSGTSMSCPTVAGLAALVLDLDPSLTPAEVRQIIRDGAIDMGPAGFDRAYGYGRIDVLNTLALVGGGCSSDPECDDGVYCNGAETCVGNACQAGTAIDCNDGVGCTDDSCNETTDSCDNVANNANCDNGLYCDGTETCHATLDCQAGTAVNCNDGVGCTADSCNEGTDTCDNIPNDAVCDDGLYCNGAESCDALFDCQAGPAINCSDGVGCTDDSCNEVTDSCDNITNNTNCDDGLFCNGAETCDALLDCQGGSDPCPGQICDEIGDVCTDCQTDPDCDDGLFCNGAETCVAGTCLAGTAVNCGDGVGCTDDSCNEGTDSCDNIANDANCDNGLYCDGSETCNAVADCQPGSAVDCNDGVGCTDDSCNESTDSCDNVPNDGSCDNGLYCDGAESCHATLDCQAGTAVSCNDGVGCTVDSCNEATDSCDNVANDGNCNDGLFCNGVETCDPALDCQTGSDPCPGQNCDEVGDLCIAPACNNNGTCESGEDCNNCAADCPSGSGASCGNGVCEAGDGEDCVSCPGDCNGLQSGKPQSRFCCGDGGGQSPVPCSDPVCTAGGFSCTDVPAVPSCCGDLVCEGSETSFDCELDCGAPPSCGDATCDASEDSCNCPADCGAPPATESSCTDGFDNDCDTFTDCNDSDCSTDPACACGGKGAACSTGSDCCSGSCKANGTCR